MPRPLSRSQSDFALCVLPAGAGTRAAGARAGLRCGVGVRKNRAWCWSTLLSDPQALVKGGVMGLQGRAQIDALGGVFGIHGTEVALRIQCFCKFLRICRMQFVSLKWY